MTRKHQNQIVENFPQWAVCYAAYGDADNLTVDEIEMIDEYMETNSLAWLTDASEYASFSNRPAFGLACEVVSASFQIR